MRKISKVLVVVMALVLCFSLFSGFTYSTNLAENGYIDLYPNESKTFHIASGEKFHLTLGYSGPCNKILVDNENYTDFDFSSGYGASALNVHNLSNGTHVISFSIDLSNNRYNDYSCVVVVGSVDPEIPPSFAQAIVKFYTDDKSSKLMSSYTCDLDTQLTNIPTAPEKEGFKFVSWAYYNGSLKQYINFDDTNKPTITLNKLQNGILKVVPVYKEIKECTITYKTAQPGFLGIKDWKDSLSIKVILGSIVPDVTDKYGIAFDFMALDQVGKLKVTEQTQVTDNMTVYVFLKDLPDTFEINYKTLEYEIYSGTIVGDYLHTNFKYDYIAPGNVIKTDIIVPDVRSHDNTNELYKFSYWSFDEAGKNEVSSGYVPTKNTILYAQYDGIKSDKATGVLGFFEALNDNVLIPMNAWWGVGGVWDYAITIAVLIGVAALIFNIIKYILKSIF